MSKCTEEIFHQEAGLVCRKTFEIAERDKIIDKCLSVIESCSKPVNYIFNEPVTEFKYSSTLAEMFLNSDLIKKYKEKRGV